MSARLAEVLAEHREWEVFGGTAVGSTWVCGCNATETVNGTRDYARVRYSAHVTAAVTEWIGERLRGARGDVGECINEADWCESNYTRGCTCQEWRTKQADAALDVVAVALGVRDE